MAMGEEEADFCFSRAATPATQPAAREVPVALHCRKKQAAEVSACQHHRLRRELHTQWPSLQQVPWPVSTQTEQTCSCALGSCCSRDHHHAPDMTFQLPG